MKNDELLHKWVNKTINKEELELFKQRPEYQELVAIYQRTDNLEGPDFNSEQILSNILSTAKIDQNGKEELNTKDKAKVLNLRWLSLVAASFLVLAVYFIWPTDNHVLVTQVEGTEKEYKFPDGSKFHLYGGSSINYDKKEWGRERIVSLEGNCDFDVEKGNKFLVETQNGNVEVLGTSFNVESVSNMFNVSCKTGRVSVESKISSHELTLNAGESIAIMKSGSSILIKNNITTMKNVTLKRVAEELENRFKLKVDLPKEKEGMFLNSSFQNKDAEEALRTALTSTGATFSLENNKVVLNF